MIAKVRRWFTLDWISDIEKERTGKNGREV
jgi:hypothetical protein